MTKYHIKPDGTPGVCNAQAGNCPYGGADEHFNSIVEAQEAADNRNEEEYMSKNITRAVEKPDIRKPGFSKQKYKVLSLSGNEYAEETSKITSTVSKKDLERALVEIKGDLKQIDDARLYQISVFEDFPETSKRRVKEDLELKTKKDAEAKKLHDEMKITLDNMGELMRTRRNIETYLRYYDKKKVSSEEIVKATKEMGYEIDSIYGYSNEVDRFPRFKNNRKEYLPEINVRSERDFESGKTEFKSEIQTMSYGYLDSEEIEKVVEGYNKAIKTNNYLKEIDWTAVDFYNSREE